MTEGRVDFSKISFEDVVDPVINPQVEPPKEKVTKPIEKIDQDNDSDLDAVQPDAKATSDKVEQSVDTPIYESLNKLIGYEVDGEFEESVEGIAEYTKKVGQKMAESEVKELFEAYPDVKEYLQFRLNDGDPAKYFESRFGDMDYSKIKITEQDEATQELVVKKYLSAQDYNEDEIAEFIKDYKDTNLLYKTAQKVVSKLVTTQSAKKEALVSSQAEKAMKAEQDREQFVQEISSTIEKGSLHDLIIPEKERREFKSWLLNVDKKGETRRQQVMSKLSMEQKLQLEYLVFKGFNLKDLVRKEATQTKIDFLKKQTGDKGSRLGGLGKEEQFKSKASKLEGLKINDIL